MYTAGEGLWGVWIAPNVEKVPGAHPTTRFAIIHFKAVLNFKLIELGAGVDG